MWQSQLLSGTLRKESRGLLGRLFGKEGARGMCWKLQTGTSVSTSIGPCCVFMAETLPLVVHSPRLAHGSQWGATVKSLPQGVHGKGGTDPGVEGTLPSGSALSLGCQASPPGGKG